MVTYLNHVTIATPRNGTSSHTVGPTGTGGTVVDGATFTPTAGNLLVCLVEGAVTSTTPSGWTLPSGGSAINNTGLYVWHRTAAGGGDSLATNHNGSNYPVVFDFYEFAAGSTFVGSAAAINVVATPGGAGPTLSGLTGSNWVAASLGQGVIGSTGSVTWSNGVEEVDTSVAKVGTDGYVYSLTVREDYTGSSSSSVGTMSGGSGFGTERLVFAVNAVAGGGGTTPVSTTRATTWAVAARVTATRATSWPVRTPVTATRATSWAARTALAATRTTAWGVRGQVVVTRATSYDVAGRVVSSRSTTWGVREAVATVRGTGWGVLQAAATARSATWGVLARVSASREVSWALRSALSATRSTGWGVLSPVTITRTTTWDTLFDQPVTPVAATRSTTWGVLTGVGITRSTAWATLVTVQATRGTTWGIGGVVTVTRAATWAVRETLTVDRATSWTVLSSLEGTRATTWAVLTVTMATRSTGWEVAGGVQATVSTTWRVLALLGSHDAHLIVGVGTGSGARMGARASQARLGHGSHGKIGA